MEFSPDFIIYSAIMFESSEINGFVWNCADYKALVFCLRHKCNSNIIDSLSGIACFTIGLVILFLDLRYPDDIALFFGIDPLADYEEYHLSMCLLCDVISLLVR
jgi:hypothetical protein